MSNVAFDFVLFPLAVAATTLARVLSVFVLAYRYSLTRPFIEDVQVAFCCENPKQESEKMRDRSLNTLTNPSSRLLTCRTWIW